MASPNDPNSPDTLSNRSAEKHGASSLPSMGNSNWVSENGHEIRLQRSRVESIWPAENMAFSREALMVFLVCMAQFCTQAAFFQTLVLLHTIGASFGVTEPARLAWLVAGFSLTVGTFILFSGRLGDVFGHKRMLLLGFGWFSAWSVVAGLSVYSNYVLAVFTRVLQGIGPAICLPNALAILGAVYPPSHRKAMVFAIFGAVAPTGAIVGAAIGSAIALAWWPWALFTLSIWLAVLAVLGLVAIPDLPRKEPDEESWTWRRLVDELDLTGAATGVVALILFNFAWIQAPISGWGTVVVIVPLILGLALFAAFVIIELKFASKPLLPLAAVNADVAFVLGVVACGWATFGIWSLYSVQIFQQIRHLPPLLTVAWLTPLVVFGIVAAIMTGKLLGPWQVRPPVVMTLALAAFTIGIVLMATAPTDQVYWGQAFVSAIVMPFGMDMSFPAATLILSDAVGKEHQGIDASLVNTVVNYGIALGVGFAGTVEIHVGHGDPLAGFRGGLYMGIGLAGLGLGLCVLFLVRERWVRRPPKIGA